MTRQFTIPGMTTAALSAVLIAGFFAPMTFAQGTRTEVTSTPLHLVMNGSVAKTDQNETDFETVDIDLDGDLDVVVGRKTPFTSSVVGLPNVLLINDGAGHLTDETATYTNWNAVIDRTREVKHADMNNDGWPDIIFFNTENESTAINLNLGNDAQGNWLGMASTSTLLGATNGNFNFCGGTAFDYNLDGFMDLYRVNYSSGSVPSSAGDDLMRQDPLNPMTFIATNSAIAPFSGGALFTQQQSFGTRAQSRMRDGSIMDLNGDGFVDLKIAGSGRSAATFSDGMGGFFGSKNLSDVGTSYDSVAADFDNDGLPDIIKIRDGNDIFTKNMGVAPDGTILEGASEVLGAGSVSGGFGANPSVCDFDGDGLLDVFVCPVDVDIPNCGNGITTKLFMNTGASPGRFVVSTTFTLPDSVFDMATEDFDGDGLPDVLLSGCNGTGWHYYVSDPNAQAGGDFEVVFIPAGAGLDLTIRNIPVHSGNFRTLYNLISLDLTQPIGSGPILGMPGDVVGQFNVGPPFKTFLAPNVDEYVFFIPPVVAALGLDVRTMSIAIDAGTGNIDLTEITDTLANP
ncbi:MAG: VCBS repeat-containing protein [Planctomycetota bacterium]